MDSETYNQIVKLKDYFTDLEEYVEFHDDKVNPYGIYRTVYDYMANNGTIVKKKISIDGVEYEVFDDSIDSPVLGIALHSLDNKYICGLNTLLDKKEIPWVKGINCYRLEYTCGIRVLGGTYFFDCAIMEKTATIPFEYRARFREIVVAGEYEAEGVFVIPHDWSETP